MMTPSPEHPPGEDPGAAVPPRSPRESLADLVASMTPVGEAERADHRSDRLDSVIVLVLTVVIALVAMTGLGEGTCPLENRTPTPGLRAEQGGAGPASS